MGEIVFWTIMRAAITIPVVWLLQGYFDFKFWWAISLFAIYGAIIHPAIIHYRLFEEKNKDVIESTLCSSCRHFDKTAVLCMKHDEHPTQKYLPCDGIDWEPRTARTSKDELKSE
jgi:hypothetical protein